MNRLHQNRCKSLGFTLLELIVVVLILIVLAGILAPTVRGLIYEAKANKILELADTLKQAGMLYYGDTQLYPVEDSGDPSSPLWDACSHTLIRKPAGSCAGIPHWNGPYIERAVSLSDHPSGEGRVWLSNVLEDSARGFAGFDFDGTGPMPAVNGSGNMLVVENLVERVAITIDRRLDGDPGSQTWSNAGKVYFKTSGSTTPPTGILYIFLLDVD